MAVDIENLRAVVVTGLKEYLGCLVIKSNQNAHMPDYPYVTYTVTTVATENNGTYGEWEDGVARKGVNTVWSITARSNDSVESVTLASKAREWLEYAGTTYLNDNDVIVQAVTSISNRDNVLTSDYEYANGFDCFFWCSDEIDISGIETIEVAVIDSTEVSKENYADIIADLNRKLDEAYADLENIRVALAMKGVAVTSETPTSEFPELIGELAGGVVDTELDEKSTNAVQNKVITAVFQEQTEQIQTLREDIENKDHNTLTNLDGADQHPIKAIKGLTAKLDGKIEEIPALSNLEIEQIINSFT